MLGLCVFYAWRSNYIQITLSISNLPLLENFSCWSYYLLEMNKGYLINKQKISLKIKRKMKALKFVSSELNKVRLRFYKPRVVYTCCTNENFLSFYWRTFAASGKIYARTCSSGRNFAIPCRFLLYLIILTIKLHIVPWNFDNNTLFARKNGTISDKIKHIQSLFMEIQLIK